MRMALDRLPDRWRSMSAISVFMETPRPSAIRFSAVQKAFYRETLV